jgi:hypothetical protein
MSACDLDFDHRGSPRSHKATLPEAADSWPVQTDDRGLIRLWLDRPFVDRLGQMRGPGES